MSNPYDILGISRDSTIEQVKKRYKELAKKYHPDVNKDPGSEDKFKEYSSAYNDIISGKKEMDDGVSFHGFGPDDEHIMNLFRHFNDMFGNRSHNRVYNVRYTISLDEAYSGKNAQIVLKGKDNKEKIISFYIHPGVVHGYVFKSKIDNEHEVNIMIEIANHPKWIRLNSKDLKTTIQIDYIDHIIGSETELKCIDGSVIKVKLPPYTERILKIQGKGMKLNGNITGDLYVEIDPCIPKHNNELIKILKEFKNRP